MNYQLHFHYNYPILIIYNKLCIFIKYVINTVWEKTDISFLIKDYRVHSNFVIFIGELLLSQEKPINLIANAQSSYCVLNRIQLLLYLDKKEYNSRSKEYSEIIITNIDSVIMFQYKQNDKNMLYCIDLSNNPKKHK